jgi:hypothetical protein
MEVDDGEQNLKSDHEDVESRRLLKVERRNEGEGNINKEHEMYQVLSTQVEHIIKDDTPTYIGTQYNWYSTPYLSGGGESC